MNKGAAAMENKAAVRSLDDWLGQEGKRVRGKNTRELEKHPTSESYFPRQMETISQYDSEMRANMMVRNSKKLRAVEEQLNEIYGKSRTAGMTNIPTVSKSFAVDEVLGKLSAESLHLIHEKFKAMGGELNVSEFVEVVSSHLPRHEWEDHAGMANNLCEVYERLDVDGDGVVSWEEMFEFTIEMGRSMNTKAAADNVDDVILEKLKVDEGTLRALNPRLVYADLAAYGGEDTRAGYDAVLQAETGFQSRKHLERSGGC